MELNRVFYIDDLPYRIDKELLLTRLSFKKTKNELGAELSDKINKASEIALNISNPYAAYTIAHFKTGCDNLYIDDYEFNSSFLRGKMSGSLAAVLMAVTLGNTVDEKINELMSQNEYTCAVIIDAAASLIADSAVESLKEHLDILLSEEGLKSGSFRISPGQTGIPLEMQKIIYDKLSLDKIGITINDKMMLTPQKSIISLTGIFKI